MEQQQKTQQNQPNNEDLARLKAEIGYRLHCSTCVACGECDKVLQLAIDEWREAQGTPQPCSSCRM